MLSNKKIINNFIILMEKLLNIYLIQQKLFSIYFK